MYVGMRLEQGMGYRNETGNEEWGYRNETGKCYVGMGYGNVTGTDSLAFLQELFDVPHSDNRGGSCWYHNDGRPCPVI